MLLSSIIVTFALHPCFSESQASESLLIQLNKPKAIIRGHILKSLDGNDYYAYQDIPYAEPPIGENRFSEPKPHLGWKGVLNVTENKKICLQEGISESTEDCLILNVYSPVTSNSTKLPVLFWIHGGSYITGSGQIENLNPKFFVEHNIVVVTINYRLGAFGFLTTGDDVIPGNNGLKDQQLALKWVNKNIVLFGGDPEKVTLAGQSVGANAISHHILSEKSTGLFRAAILQSASALVSAAYVPHYKNYSFQLGQILNNNCTFKDSKELLELLKRVSAEDILAASQKVQSIDKSVGILPNLVWAVIIENENNKNALITRPMHLSLMNGNFDRVPILAGFTSMEMLEFAGSIESLRESTSKLDENPANLIPLKWNIPKTYHSIAGRKIKKVYTNNTFLEDFKSYFDFSNDIGIVNPIIRVAQLTSVFVPAYLYKFSYVGEAHQNSSISLPNIDGASHGEEIFYMWQMSSKVHSDILTSQRLLKMWTGFIKYLNPTLNQNSTLEIPKWPKLEPQRLSYLDIDHNITIREDLTRYRAMEAIYEEYFKPPYNVY